MHVRQHPERLEEMLTLSGGRQQVPVIVDGEKVMVGFAGASSLRGGVPLYGGT